MNKDELIQNLQTSLEVVYEVDTINDEIQTIQRGIEQVNTAAKKMKMGCWVTTLLWILFSGVILIAIAGVGRKVASMYFVDWATWVKIVVIIVSLLIGLVLVSIISGKRDEKAKAYADSKIPSFETAIAVKSQELEAIASSDRMDVLSRTVPQAYATIDALEFILTTLLNQRADTLKEALNLYETHLNQMQLMEAQGQIIDLAQQNVALSQEMAMNQRQIINNQQQQLKNQQQEMKMQNAILQKTRKVSRQMRFSNAFTVVNTVRHWKR